MSKFSMTEALPTSQRQPRDVAEDKALGGLGGDGRNRLRAGKEKQVIFRTTVERKQQLTRLAELLSVGRSTPATFTETMERALDALEEKMTGGKSDAGGR